MKILVICKRQYTNKDVLNDRFGRLFELPEGLARLGHEVKAAVLSYRPRGATRLVSDAGVRWHSRDAWPLAPWGLDGWLDQVTGAWWPDVVWASSDMWCVLVASGWARRRGIPYVADLYDNYESFGLSRWPGLRRRFVGACRQASSLTVVGRTLGEYVGRVYRPKGDIHMVLNGVPQGLFHPQSRMEARASLGLPLDAPIIGTAGALAQDRGISDLFEAFFRIASQRGDAMLAVAGTRDAASRHLSHPRMIDLGALPQTRVPTLLAALDVGVVCNRDTEFGRYCYPLKLHEMLAMEIPVVAASLGDVSQLLSAHPQCLYKPGDVAGLAMRLEQQLQSPHAPTLSVPDWDDSAAALEVALRTCLLRGEGLSLARF
ncbi:glycosyltransferase [Pseudoxanthomonas mexicana]